VLAEYREAGIHSAILSIPDLTRDEILAVVDKYAKLIG
jgi:septum formation topological specificity factor MinE